MGDWENASIPEALYCWNGIYWKKRDEATGLREKILKILSMRLRVKGIWLLLMSKEELQKGFK